MKRLLAALLACALAVFLAGCAGAAPDSSTTPSSTASVPDTSALPSGTDDILDTQDVMADEDAAAGEASPHQATPAEVGIQAGTAADYTENVLRSSAVHARDGELYLAYQSQLVRAALDAEGEPEDGTVLMDVMPTINSLAGDDETLYLATNDGIFALPAGILQGADLGQGKLLAEYDVSTNPFYIWDDWLFFLYDNQVYVMPKAGGTIETLMDGVVDFQVTDRGLFCTGESGALTFLSFTDGESAQVIDADCGGRITFLEDTAYVTTGKAEPKLYAFSVPDRQAMEINLTTTLSATHGVWPEPAALVCQADDGRVVLYDLGANSETELGQYNMPYYEFGELSEGILYNMSGDELTWMHLDSGETGSVQMRGLIASAPDEEE